MLWRKLAKHLRIGRLVVRGLAATDLEFGNCDPHRPDLDVAIRIRDRRAAWKLAVRPDPYVGEAYMSGFLVIERGSLRDFLEICFLNFRGFAWTSRQSRLGRVARRLLRRLQRQNSRRKAQRNVAHHYDLSDDLYRRFLDADRQYSCAYFADPDATLEAAHRAKKKHILECAPRGGQDQAATLTVCRAWWFSNCTGLR